MQEATDPLLYCLTTITKINRIAHSKEDLLAGLPLVNNKLTAELFVRAAERIDLSSKIVNRNLDQISSLVMPVVLLLQDNNACVLLSKTKRYARILQLDCEGGVSKISIANLSKQYTGTAIFIKPSYSFDLRTQSIDDQDKTANWFWGVIKKVWPLYMRIIVASLLINLFALATPLFTMNVYDRVIPNAAKETLWVLAIGVGLIFLFDFVIKMLRGYFIDIAGKKSDVLLSARIYEQMLGIKMEDRPESVGNFANNMGQFESFREFITSTTISTVIDVPFIVIFIAVIYSIGGNLALIPMIAVPVVICAGFFIQIPLNKWVKTNYRYTGQKQALLIESLNCIETIKSVSAEGPMQSKWEHLIGMASKINIKVKVLTMLATNLATFSQQIAGTAIIILGVYNIIAGNLTMGALIACNMLSSRALAPLAQIASLLTRYQQSMTALKSIDQIMNLPIDREHNKKIIHKTNKIGNIELKEFNFKYKGQDALALNNINIKIKAGEKIAVLGKIGSGKSTLNRAIMGLITPVDGNLLFDNLDSRQLDLTYIRKNIGYVSQDNVLLYGSIRDNIVLGAPYVDDNTILRAATIAGVMSFVATNPKGFSLNVGERGEKLSGGQRQSIAIARALLLSPPIVVLDEPTSMMDNQTSAEFLQNFHSTYKEQTVIISTHNLALLQIVDRVIIMDSGVIVADGPRDKILAAVNAGKIGTATAAAKEQHATA